MKIGDVVEVNLIGEIEEIKRRNDEIYYIVKSGCANNDNEYAYVKGSRLVPAENK